MFKSEDGTVTKDHFMAQWSKILLGAAEKIGKTFAIYDFNREMITQAGFVDVVEKKYKVPVGTWPRDPKMKELGQWNLLFCLEGLESWSLYLLSMILKVRDVRNLGRKMLSWDGGLTRSSGRTKRFRCILRQCATTC
jgi:hypothetical protein